MWIFRKIADRFEVGYLRGEFREFTTPYEKLFLLEEAEAKVHYLNGGAAGAVGDLQDSLAERLPIK